MLVLAINQLVLNDDYSAELGLNTGLPLLVREHGGVQIISHFLNDRQEESNLAILIVMADYKK